MTPPSFDTDVVARRLRLLRESLDQLATVKGADAEQLAAEPLTRAAAERLIQVVVDLAIDVLRVASAIEVVVDGFDTYVKQVAAFARDRAAGTPRGAG